MISALYLLALLLFGCIIAAPQINLHHTSWVNESTNTDTLPHHCLRVDEFIHDGNITREIVLFCLDEWSSQFHAIENDLSPKFTFAQLAQQNVTSQELFAWSIPIDTIEEYQLFLNELALSIDSTRSHDVVYNCTLPRFGSKCQYEIDYYDVKHSSLYDLIFNAYRTYKYSPTALTCYVHLQCTRGHSPACLDWTAICDGRVDCDDGGLDEAHCWQLEVNECEADEFRCTNGQCIPTLFWGDHVRAPDCRDGSDELSNLLMKSGTCASKMPTFECEETICQLYSLTSSCHEGREQFLFDSMNLAKDESASSECWLAFRCYPLYMRRRPHPDCGSLCANDMCLTLIDRHCPPMFFMPITPILFSELYLAYEKYNATLNNRNTFPFPFICVNQSRYDAFFASEAFHNNGPYSIVVLNNLTCHRHVNPFFVWQIGIASVSLLYLRELRPQLWPYHEIYNYDSTMCNRSNMYRCVQSVKCVSRHRLMNSVIDCPHRDDENATLHNYTAPTEIFLGTEHLIDEDLMTAIRHARTNVLFQTICDGFVDLLPIEVDGRNETDESECQRWACNNTYTHCNGIWNCLNGADEVNCDPLSPTFNYSSPQHLCVSPKSNLFIHLPLDRANDGVVDCLGGQDEPGLCRAEYTYTHGHRFYCRDTIPSVCITQQFLCSSRYECAHGDDEQFCISLQNCTSCPSLLCWSAELQFATDVEKFLCKVMDTFRKAPVVFFQVDGMAHQHEVKSAPILPGVVTPIARPSRCQRGLDLHVWLNDSRARQACLCPPSYYGEQCQFQNQRLSVSLKFKAASNSWQTPFAAVILLVDDDHERFIHSHEQLTYLSIRDCTLKFQQYLTYSQRPKNESKNYAVQMHIYEKISVRYRASFFFPVRFNFLPVHLLPLLITIPASPPSVGSCSLNRCVNGECLRYSNDQQRTFCRCFNGWSGRDCTVRHLSSCATGSVHVGVSPMNQSICVCPLGRFGPRCLLHNPICQHGGQCENGGLCVPADEYMMKTNKFSCICREGFIGDQCQSVLRRIVLLFDTQIALTQSIFIHLIEAIADGWPVRATTFRTVPVQQHSLVLYWSRPVHVVFIELSRHEYYFALAQPTDNQSTLTTSIHSTDRCPHIQQIFDASIVQQHLIRRIKHYHWPCQQLARNLSCFYDETQLCFCYDFGHERLSNCFEFDHQMNFDCSGQSVCQNGGRCFQDTPHCPKRSICVCSACFYGAQCQFSTRGFGLSLDAILGYHIRPSVSLVEQSAIVKVSLAMNVILVVLGCVNGVLVMITFRNPNTRDNGCGLYLFGSSVFTLLTMILFGAKCWILTLAQMATLTDRTFLRLQCITLDFLLQLCLGLDEWLRACVGIDRALTATQGVSRAKKQSKQSARLIIVVVVMAIVATSAYDPFYRQLIDEENDSETRTWCIANYPSQLKTFSSAMHSVHFFAPFIINLISAIVLISTNSRRRSNLQIQRTYNQILRKELQEQKNLVIAPTILVVLALPRLIIAFISKCMKSADDSWIFLVGYYISFVPSMLTFLIYIVPSKFYQEEFRKSFNRYRTAIRKRLHISLSYHLE